MELSNPYYKDYDSVETGEELFLTFSRALLELQEDSSKNSNKLDYIDISTTEDNKLAQVEIKSVPCRLIETGLEVINLFTDDIIEYDSSGDFLIPYPFKETSLLSALCKLGIWLADKELDSSLNSQGRKILSYSFNSSRAIGDLPISLSISARDLPLEVVRSGGWQSTRSRSWLSGTI